MAFAEDMGSNDTSKSSGRTDNSCDNGIIHFSIGALIGSFMTILGACVHWFLKFYIQ
jgi:hypothetical protein